MCPMRNRLPTKECLIIFSLKHESGKTDEIRVVLTRIILQTRRGTVEKFSFFLYLNKGFVVVSEFFVLDLIDSTSSWTKC